MSERQRPSVGFFLQLWILPAVTMLLLTGCSAEGADIPLPTAARPSPASTSPESRIEAIERAYIAFVEILDRADSLAASTRRQELSAHMTDPQLTRVIDRIEEMKRTGIATYGKLAAHVHSVRIDGPDATIRDCQDSSEAGILNVRTGKKIRRGVKKENIKAYLSEGSDSRWRVTKSISYGKGC